MNWLIRQREWLFLVVALGLVSLYVVTAGGGFPLDDSWIHQSYGRNLGLSGEWSLVPGQPSAASTAPLYTLILAVGYVLRIPYMFWTHFVGALALWGIGVFGGRLAQRLLPKNPYVGLIVGTLLILTWQMIWAGASGMETALSAMWTLLLPLMVFRETDENRESGAVIPGALFGMVAALAVLTRPEGIGIAGLCGLALLIRLPHGWRHFLLWTLGAAIGFAVFITPYVMLNLRLTGGLLPNTSAAKQAQHMPLMAIPYLRRVWMMFIPIWIGGQILLLPGVVMYIISRVRSGRTAIMDWIFPTWIMLLILVYAARLPAAYQHGRYVMPVMPAAVLIGTIGAIDLVNRSQRTMLTRVLSQTMFGAAVMLFAGTALGVGPGVYATDVAIINEEMVATAHWIDENIPVDDFMAIHDIGAVSYFTPRPMLDVAGLVSPEVVPIVNDADALWALMQERDAQYLMAFPDQIPGDDPNDPRLCEVFITNGQTSQSVEGPNMAVYRLAWDENCDG